MRRISGPKPGVPRRGFSLMEIILATAILMGSVVVLARLAGMGRNQAWKAERHSEAQRVCETTLNEIMLGLRPLENVDQVPLLPLEQQLSGGLEEQISNFDLPARTDGFVSDSQVDPAWIYSVNSEPLSGKSGLLVVTVEVFESEPIGLRPVQFQLTRWVRAQSESELESNSAETFEIARGLRQ